MRVRHLVCLVATALVGCASAGWQTSRIEQDRTPVVSRPAPFFEAHARETEYVGPGRDEPVPEGLTAVKIGWFGPAEPDHPLAGSMWCAATMALQEANKAGGYRGLPFVLVPSWSENPWGTGIKGVARLAYDERVWAFVGAPDGPSAHLVEQVVAKARAVFINPVSTDTTANLANVPWIFSCAPGDHLLMPVVAHTLAARARERGPAVISCTDHDSRMSTKELLDALGQLNAYPAVRLEFIPGGCDFGIQLQRIRQARPGVIAVIAGAADSARFVSALRQGGLDQPVFGGAVMGRRLFLDIAGPLAEGVRFPLLWDSASGDAPATRFCERFKTVFGYEPDYAAAHTYDAVNLLIAAIHKTGLNRARIRDAVRELSPFNGVTGTIAWDPTGRNTRPVVLGTIRNGRVVPIPSS